MNKKILFVAYHFPPDAEVGALRTQKYVKFLKNSRLELFVLTIKDKYYPVQDSRRMHDVSDATIVRTAFLRTPLQFYFDLRDKFFSKSSCKKNISENFSLQVKEKKKIKNMSYSLRIISSLNHLPDDKLYWIIPGLIHGLKLIKQHKISVIIVSAPPHSSIILAYFLAVISKCKLIIDFRDPWTLTYDGNKKTFKTENLLVIEKRIERLILKKTSAIITTNDFFREALLQQHSFLSSDNVHVIQNGFDSDDMPETLIKKSGIKYVISYLGTFYMQRNPQIFLQALSLFMHDKKLNEHDIEVKFVGYVEKAQGISVKEMAKDVGLEKVVNLVGKVSYAKALRIMCESDLLLLLAPNQPYQIPAKTYEYIATRNPILALCEHGATSALIKKINCGIAVDPLDIEGVKSALHHFFNDFKNSTNAFKYDPSVYERKNNASQLVKILKQI